MIFYLQYVECIISYVRITAPQGGFFIVITKTQFVFDFGDAKISRINWSVWDKD
jgi:hypothetical protein